MAHGNDNMIGYAKVVSVSTSCNRYYILALSTLFYDSVILYTIDLFLILTLYIYRVDMFLYLYTLPIVIHPFFYSQVFA